jgi:hypothetical protein
MKMDLNNIHLNGQRIHVIQSMWIRLHERLRDVRDAARDGIEHLERADELSRAENQNFQSAPCDTSRAWSSRAEGMLKLLVQLARSGTALPIWLRQARPEDGAKAQGVTDDGHLMPPLSTSSTLILGACTRTLLLQLLYLRKGKRNLWRELQSWRAVEFAAFQGHVAPKSLKVPHGALSGLKVSTRGVFQV